jgi:membrane-associated phospholipid phosphatase
MDMSFLLLLQAFRNGSGSFLVDFMKKMTFFGELNTTLVILAIIYWCISKDLGTYLMMGWSGNRIANGFMKITVCAYRPWIRDSRIIPHGDAITTATGYSFPSGHTMNAGTVFGGTAMYGKNFSKPLKIMLYLIVVLVALSRTFLGVHTPQDVLVGMASSLLVMWLTLKLTRWIAEKPEKDKLVACIGFVLAIALGLYAALKSYPVDYDSNGKIIVEGAKMANDTFKAVGWVSAFLTGWILERRFVGFSTDISKERRFSRGIFGIMGYYAVTFVLNTLLKKWIPGPAGTILTCFLQMFYITFLFPWIMKKAESK